MQYIITLTLIASLFAVTTPVAEPSLPEPQTFLRKQLAFTPLELSALESGQIIVKLPKTDETREVAAFAIGRLDVPAEFFLKRMRDIVNFKKSENVLQIGKFSDPPRLEDLTNLTLDSTEMESMRRCKVSQCDFKMSASAIERFRKQVNWSAPDYRERVTALTHEMLFEYVHDYLHGGNGALGEYSDKGYRLRVAEELQSILQPAPYMYGYAAEFQKYLREFPNSRPAYVENFFYWSKEKFGLKPVISVTHVTVYKLSQAYGEDVLIASKGIYANHYFEASLGLTAFIHSKSSDPPRTYLIYINRSKTDALRGFLAGFKRSLIGGSVRDGAKKHMGLVKEKLEADYVQ
jgi:hypothetical protein